MDPHFECGSGSGSRRAKMTHIQNADPDPDPGGQKLPINIEKSQEF
jgi:hypothetical protein